MAPEEEVPVLQQFHPSINNQKAQIIYKLFLLENVRSTTEQDLHNFIKQAYEEAQAFLNSPLPCTVFTDVMKSLDMKCQVMAALSALLKGFTADTHDGFQTIFKKEVKPNQLQPLALETLRRTEAAEFEPILKNSLVTNSTAKAVQVVGAPVSPQQLKPPPHSQPARPDPEIVPFVITQSHGISSERPRLLPPIQALRPEISNSKPSSITALISWERQGDVQVQHQKQTSCQLQLFLREKSKTGEALEVTVTEWSRSTYALRLPRSTSPAMKSRSYQIRHVVTDDLADAPAAKSLHVNMENQSPVFRVKRVESGGSLIYSCVITTETELWDFGDILTGVVRGDSKPVAQERGGNHDAMAQVDKARVSVCGKTQTLQCTEADNISAVAKIPTINNVNIPQFQTRRFEETEVLVSHVVDPGNFYIQHADSPEKLQPLITDSWKPSSSYAEQNCIPDLGTRVMAWFPMQEQWCRAQVMKICGVSIDKDSTDGLRSKKSITVEVMRLDHGDSACLSLWNIKELTPELAALPLQALQVSLANVTPVNGRHWSEESVGWFKRMVHNRTFYARLYPQGPNFTVELFLEKGKLGAMRRGASLSLRLAQNGHANHSQMKNKAPMTKNAARVQARKLESDWEKYLISCHSQSRK